MIRIFGVSIPASGVVLFCSEVILLIGSFLLAGYLVVDGDVFLYFGWELGTSHTLAILIGMLWTAYMLDMYSNVLVESILILIPQMVLRCGVVFLLEAVIGYLHVGGHIPLRLLATGCTISAVLMTIWRVVYSQTIFLRMNCQDVLFVGKNFLVHSLVTYIAEHPEQGLRVLGYVSDDPEPESSEPCKYLGRIDQLKEIFSSTNTQRVIVGMGERRGRLPVSVLLEIRLAGCFVEEAATAYERYCHRVSVPAMLPSQLVFSGTMGPRQKSYLMHVLLDMLGALIGSLVFLPVVVVIVIAMKLTSAGPLLYRQRRIGLNGQPFHVLKFRTMDENPDNPSEPVPTRIGNLLRKLRMNELPQLLNVLRGEMSIVGPRPERPEYVRVFCEKIPYYMQRHCVRPGITGWAQINYLHGDTVEDTITKLEYDLYYIKYLSHTLDLFVIFHTIKTVLLSRGAG